MADRPGSYKSSHNVSRHTMVMRRAKDDDAQRIAEREESQRLEAARQSLDVSTTSSRRTARMERREGPPPSGRTVSGRTVVVRREGEISKRLSVTTRLSGTQASSVRVTGGDTIIRYQSGDMVIKRGARRAQLRRQLIWAYALGYLLLFGCYVYFLLTGTMTMAPEAYVDKAFSRRHGTDVIELERAAFEAMRGNRTPAEVRLAETISFYDEDKDLIRVDAGSRLTLLTAAKLGKAIIEDQRREPSKRTFSKPFRLYKETYLANMNWPFWLTIYNAVGFFLLMILFLWRPLQNFLGTQGKKTAVALRNAREAQEEAQEYREKYRRLAREIEEKGETMRLAAAADGEREREAALEKAREQAGGIEGGIESALAAETRAVAGRLGAGAAAAACDQARRLLEQRLGQAEHDAAIDELIADITGMRLT